MNTTVQNHDERKARDTELALRYKATRSDADFEKLYQRLESALYSFAMRKLSRDRESVKEAIQHAFLRFVQDIDKINETTNIFSYLINRMKSSLHPRRLQEIHERSGCHFSSIGLKSKSGERNITETLSQSNPSGLSPKQKRLIAAVRHEVDNLTKKAQASVLVKFYGRTEIPATKAAKCWASIRLLSGVIYRSRFDFPVLR